MDEDQIIRRRLPPELLSEIHKCLPLADAINVLVNVPTRAIYQNNSPRMLRTVQRIKKSLNEYINTLVSEEDDDEELDIFEHIEWKPEMDTFLRYGSWLTSKRKLWMTDDIVGTPENFVGELLLYLANSSSTQMMLQRMYMSFRCREKSIPAFLQPLLNKEEYQIGSRVLFQNVELKLEDGRTFHIFDGELQEGIDFYGTLKLIVANKMDKKNWFKVKIGMNRSKKFIELFEIKQWEMQLKDHPINENGNKLEAKQTIDCNFKLDLFLRRCAGFTQFRHFEMKQPFNHNPYMGDDRRISRGYADFLINYISKTKCPEDFLESIDIHLDNDRSPLVKQVWYRAGQKELPKGGKLITVDKTQFHILPSKTKEPKMKGSSGDGTTFEEENELELEFTLANIPTDGKYVFDVNVQLANERIIQILGMKIRKRKVDEDIVELDDQIGQGEKKKATKRKKVTTDGENDEDGPSCSSKIMKK